IVRDRFDMASDGGEPMVGNIDKLIPLPKTQQLRPTLSLGSYRLRRPRQDESVRRDQQRAILPVVPIPKTAQSVCSTRFRRYVLLSIVDTDRAERLVLGAVEWPIPFVADMVTEGVRSRKKQTQPCFIGYFCQFRVVFFRPRRSKQAPLP